MLDKRRVLFVAWQDSTSRRFYPVARLSWLSTDQDEYEFVYIQGALEAEAVGFRPFLNFPGLMQRYLGRELFPLFANRLMSAKRADYPQYLNRLGLDRESSTAFEVLGRSGGRRTTDTIEIFSWPTLVAGTGTHRMYFFAHAIRYLSTATQERIGKLRPNEPLALMHDLQNPADRSALLLRTEDFTIVGFVPAYLTELTHHFIQHCAQVTVSVAQINPPSAPVQQRLLCLWESRCALPADLLDIPRYQPLPADATPGPFVGREQELIIVGGEVDD